MNKNVLTLFSLLFVFLLSVSLQAKKRIFNNKEVFQTKTSLLLIQDSILGIKYNQAKSLYETNNYVESLQMALYLNEQMKSIQNRYLQFKIIFLIAEIYRNNRDHEKAITYYKKSLKLLTNNTLDGQKIDSINQIAKYIAQLKRIGNDGHGIWNFDQEFTGD